ncbi:hypothetical protein [Hymenobacter siberiensis]|uniref:hypothetical protein n=1 Tax=Hymenobacter siberiensis TaxID=2848396 RepID=UPI001C1E55AA|nr:hypothetical protein [Hymenobacter siberiensis]
MKQPFITKQQLRDDLAMSQESLYRLGVILNISSSLIGKLEEKLRTAPADVTDVLNYVVTWHEEVMPEVVVRHDDAVKLSEFDPDYIYGNVLASYYRAEAIEELQRDDLWPRNLDSNQTLDLDDVRSAASDYFDDRYCTAEELFAN